MSGLFDSARSAAEAIEGVAKGAATAAEIAAVIGSAAMGANTDLGRAYYADNPAISTLSRTAEAVEQHADALKGRQEISDDLDGVPEPEAADHSPPPETSTFAEQSNPDDAEAGEKDVWAADLDNSAETDREVGDGDAFAADLDNSAETDREIGDSDSDSDSDSGR